MNDRGKKMLEDLKNYLDNTSPEQLKKDWEELEKFNHVGPEVSEYLERTKKRIDYIIEYWETREPFKDEEDIPDIPFVSQDIYQKYIIPNIIRCGGIPKAQLKPHTVYIGSCRNSSEAEWTGEKFIYCRHKLGTEFIDDVNHFEDDNGYDLFVPIKEK